MRCSRCKTWITPDLEICPDCAAPLPSVPTGAALVDSHRRQIAATRTRWQGAGRSGAVPAETTEMPRTGGVRMLAELAGPLNLLRLHAGLSPFRRLEVERDELVSGLELRIEANPAVVRPWVGPVSGGLELRLEPPVMSPAPGGFPDDEAMPAEVRLELLGPAGEVASLRLETTLDPADLWHAIPGEEPVLAGLVTPNAPVLSALLAGLEGDVMAYNTPDTRRLLPELEAVAGVVDALGLRYAPAAVAWGGTRGQRVANPERILACRRVCCLDLAILWSSLLERLGMHPLIVLLETAGPHTESSGSSGRSRPGHAICGVWTANIRSRQPMIRDSRVLERAVAAGDLLLFDPTLPLAGSGVADFSSALCAGRKALARNPVALDLAACRGRGLTPLPRRRS